MPGPTGGNLIVGNTSFTSDDGSMLISGGPAQGQIDFRTNGRQATLQTELLDLTSNSLDNVLLGLDGKPYTRPGKVFMLTACRVYMSDLSGTITQTAQFNAGTNTGKNNVLAANTPLSTNAAISGVGVPCQSIVVVPALLLRARLNAPLFLDITTPVVLGTSLAFHARFVLQGLLADE